MFRDKTQTILNWWRTYYDNEKIIKNKIIPGSYDCYRNFIMSDDLSNCSLCLFTFILLYVYLQEVYWMEFSCRIINDQ